MPKPKDLPMTTEEIAEKYLAGISASEIGQMCRTGYKVIQKRLRAHGIEIRGIGVTESGRKRQSAARLAPIPEDRLRELHAQQMTCREMRAALGNQFSEEAIRERLVRLGLPRLPAKARKERNYFWAGGYFVDKQGYILQVRRDHPDANTAGYVRQHRLVMEQVLGRRLLRTEVVDHVNGDTSDNRPENLRLFASNGEHLRETRTGRPRLQRAEREALRQEAVRRAHQRVAAILQGNGNGAPTSP